MRKAIYSVILLVCVSCELDSLVDVESLYETSDQNDIVLFATGGLTTQYKHHQVIIVTPQPISYGQRDDIPIRGAKVYAVSGNDTLFFDNVWGSHYKTSQKTKAEPEREYTLNIEYKGKTYTAKDKAPRVESIEFGEVPVPEYHGFWDKWHLLKIRTHFFGYKQPFKWLWYAMAHTSTGKYYDSICGVVAYMHQGMSPQGIFGGMMESKTNNSNFGTSVHDSVVAAKFSLSQDYNNYLKAYYTETKCEWSQLRGIPGNLPTNFSKGALGFFYVMDHKTLRCTVKDILDYQGAEYPPEDTTANKNYY